MTDRITAFSCVRLDRTGGALALIINGERHLPLLFAFSWAHSLYGSPLDPLNDPHYPQVHRVYEAGVRLFAPCTPEIGYAADGNFDYGVFDTFMNRLLQEIPDGWVLPRIRIPTPPLPASEKIKVSRRPGDTSDVHVHQVFDQVSLFSASYREYAPGAYCRILEHIAKQPYARRMIGSTVLGAGFECNWMNPLGDFGANMDICPAVTQAFSRWLWAKYGTEAVLCAAWRREDVNMAEPPLPGLEDRSQFDLGGFFDPSRSRWVTDFYDFYNDQPTHVEMEIFGAIHAMKLPLFNGLFHLAILNTGWPGPNVTNGVFKPVLEQPALGFVVNCLTYCDRKAGGVSAYMHFAWKSLDLHGKLAIGEADIRPPTHKDPWTEASIADTIQSMRREFAATVLCQRQGVWNFEMGPCGWFDVPELLAEYTRQMQVGQAALNLQHTNVAETLVVTDMRSWKYFTTASRHLARKEIWTGENQNLLQDMTQSNLEMLMRLGAPHDAIVAEDFTHPGLGRIWRQDGDPQADALRAPDCRAAACGVPHPALGSYKLLIFPFSFLCEPAMREEIHRRVEAGATALFLYAAGIVDGETASLDNMERLMGMKVRVDDPGVLAAELEDGSRDARHPELSGGKRAFPRAGMENAIGNPNTHHFRYVIDDPQATPLARYADGEVAAAMIPWGRGRIILSAVPAASPALYKLAAKLAGVHLYSDTDDALYASGEFLTIHTREAGLKRLRLPSKVARITELFTGEVIAQNVSELTVSLPAKATAVYRLEKAEE